MAKFDLAGVPEVFCSTVGAIEDAGDGLIRAIMCIRRDGELVPVISIVRPADDVLKGFGTWVDSSRRAITKKAGQSSH